MATVLLLIVIALLFVGPSLRWSGGLRRWWSELLADPPADPADRLEDRLASRSYRAERDAKRDADWPVDQPPILPLSLVPDEDPTDREEAALVARLLAGGLSTTDYHRAMSMLARLDELANPTAVPPDLWRDQ